MFQPTLNQGSNRRSGKIMIGIMISAVILVIGAIGVAAYFFKEYKNLKDDSGIAAQSEQKRIIDKVKKLYNTPDETPSIIQVEDEKQVSNEAFFKESKKDDYVLIYQRAKLAVLYRESTNRIINTGPIILDTDGGQESSTVPNRSSANTSTGIVTQDQTPQGE